MDVYLRTGGTRGGIGGSGWPGRSSMASCAFSSLILHRQIKDQQLKRRLWARAATVYNKNVNNPTNL